MPKGSKVHTKKGLINIEDIIIGDEVLTTQGYRKVKNCFNQGFQDIYSIPTSNGEFRCTKNHKMARFNEETKNYDWVTAEELDIGDKLILTNTPTEGNSTIKLPSFNFTERKNRIIAPDFNFDIAWLFGFMMFNKNCLFNKEAKSIKIICNSIELLKKLTKQIEKFGLSIRLITDINYINNSFIFYLKNFRDVILKEFKTILLDLFVYNIKFVYFIRLFIKDVPDHDLIVTDNL